MSIEKIIASLRTRTIARPEKMRQNAEGKLAAGTPNEIADAARSLEAIQEELMRRNDANADEQERIRQITAHMEPAGRVFAFAKIKSTSNEQKIILALLDNPGMTSSELSVKCCWRGQIWHAFCGQPSGAREPHLRPAKPAKYRDGNLLSGILADYDVASGCWTMKPEDVEGFARVGLASGRRQ